jgi:twitching motility protein PilT
VNAQLLQILGYLDDRGVTEILIAVGRKILIRQNGQLASLTSKPLTQEQLFTLFRLSPISDLIPEGDASRTAPELEVGRFHLRVEIRRRGEDLAVKISRAPSAIDLLPTIDLDPEPGQRVGRAGRTTTQPRTARTTTNPTRTPRTTTSPTKTGRVPRTTTQPRSKGMTTQPRSKGMTTQPRTGKMPTSAPRTKVATNAPRTARPPTGPQRRVGPPSIPPPRIARPPTTPPRTARPPTTPPRTARPPSTPPRTKPATSAPRSKGSTRQAIAIVRDTSSFPGIVATARERGASDLHIASGRAVSIRTLGELTPLDAGAGPLSVAAAEALLLSLLRPEHHAPLASVGYVDFAVDVPGGGRLRANVSRQQGGLKGTFRLARAKPATLEELGLPKELAKVVGHHQGLVVIAGPSGHGKTTTLSALVDLVNSSKPHHIITVEDPIEIEHPRKVAVVSQREAGRHTKSFAAALKASLREDPDVIVIGELRDRETVEIALTASETGHLVLSTMSTPSAAKTLDRLIDMFPPEEHSQVRASVAGALRAVVAQRLLPAKTGGGIVPAIELVTGVLPLAVLIRDDKLYQLPNLMQRGRAFGMIRFDESLLELVRSGRITEDTALAAADSRKELAVQLRATTAAIPKGKTP